MKTSVPQHVIHWEAAALAATAAIQAAEQLGARVNVAVVNSSGNLVAFLGAPDAFLHSLEIAIDKAYTAAGFGISTAQLAEVFAGESPTVRTGLEARQRLVTIGGGLPIRIGEMLVGAIGVSGGSEQEDILCAMAGLERIAHAAEITPVGKDR